MQFIQFNKHTNLEGLHAPFSASQSHWLRYDDEKAIDIYRNKKASAMGSRLHAWAKETIDLKMRQPRSNKTIYAYINDAIGFDMNTEVVLFYSHRFFGTADAICFRKNALRIHDLKTGKEPANIEQLYVYAALFCLEYNFKPSNIDIELRLYQNDEVLYDNKETNPELTEIISSIMDHIVHLDKILEKEDYEEV